VRTQRRSSRARRRDARVLQIFLNQAARHALLTALRRSSCQRIERGDMEAKDRMINANLRLVVSQARRYQGLGLPLGDLVQEGMLGLIGPRRSSTGARASSLDVRDAVDPAEHPARPGQLVRTIGCPCTSSSASASWPASSAS